MTNTTSTTMTEAIKRQLSEGRILEFCTFAEIDRILPSRFLRGSDWDSLNLTPYESANCRAAFDNLCLLAWENRTLSLWQIENELGIIVSEWAEKKKAPGKAIMRDVLPKARGYGWQVRMGGSMDGLE
ncbi:hypothetical protein EAF04_010883 [Stromatinia cepivora]|nr:hypothetical protein EAF04_010883 [Stromatinia cepivora]